MTDEEVICEWMEPQAGVTSYWLSIRWRVGRKVPINVYLDDRPVCQCHSPEDARYIVDTMNGRHLSLDRLREVEARLSDVQWGHYEAEMARVCWPGMHVKLRPFIHATAAQKIAALAAVIRASG